MHTLGEMVRGRGGALDAALKGGWT